MSLPDSIAGLLAVYRAFACAADGMGIWAGKKPQPWQGRPCARELAYRLPDIREWVRTPRLVCGPTCEPKSGAYCRLNVTMCRADQFVVNEPSEDLYVTFGLPALPSRFEFHPIIWYSFVPSCVIFNVLPSDTTIF